jgi:hypothetical protein
MPIDFTRVTSLDARLGPDDASLAWRSGRTSFSPRFAEPFPVDPGGLLYRGTVVPCLGIWNGLDPARRARLAGQVRLLRYQDPADFLVELLPERTGERFALGILPGARTLADASAIIAQAMRTRGGRVRRWLGFDRLGPREGVRIPVIAGRLGDTDGDALVELGTSSPIDPVPEWITLGRADAYRRNLLCHAPFFVWVGEAGSLEPRLVARIGRI